MVKVVLPVSVNTLKLFPHDASIDRFTISHIMLHVWSDMNYGKESKMNAIKCIIIEVLYTPSFHSPTRTGIITEYYIFCHACHVLFKKANKFKPIKGWCGIRRHTAVNPI